MYERYYQLRARPFQLMPDPRRLYQTSGHDRGLSYLIYGLERAEGVVVVTGDVGTGKTLLLQVLLGQIPTRGLSVARVAMANADADTVVASVAAAFGVSVRGQSRVELLDALAARLSAGRNRRGLLIVDEAQTCGDAALEELRLLSNLQARGEALLQLVLVGQTELRARLKRAEMSHLRQRIVASFHLEPLAENDVAGYIEHRLDCVGWRRDKLSFEPGVYARVHEWSRGVPRRINQIMDRLLLLGYLEERRQLGVTDLDTAIEEFEAEFGADGLIYDAEAGADTADADVIPSISEDPTESALLGRIGELEQALTHAIGAERVQRERNERAERELATAWFRLQALEDTVRVALPNQLPADSPLLQRAGTSGPGALGHGDDMPAMLRRLFGQRERDE